MEQLERLRRAEAALATAESTEDAARELVDHAIALLAARSAVVLIEGSGETIRVSGGDPDAVYLDGSRMRLLEAGGLPVGSIAVGPREGGAPYTSLDERILDALGEAISSSLDRLALFDQVRREQSTLQDVLSSSSDGIFSSGPDHRIRAWNPAMERITGLSPRGALREQCCSVFRPVDGEGRALVGAACPGRNGRHVDALPVRIVTASGEERWLACTWSPMNDGGSVVVARDVTAQKRVEDQKADFLATVSHELRTPLTPILGFLDTLLREDERFTPDDRRRVYRLMLQQGKRLDRLVKDLLVATSLDDPEGLHQPEVLEWPEIATGVVEQFRRQDPTRELRVTVRKGVTRVLADRQRAEHVLANLLDNALKYTPAGTPVQMIVEREDDAVVTVVEDRGTGIAPEDRQLVFERFTRLGDHLTREQGGAGLGLYIARRLVEGMGGRIEVGQSRGGGAAFRFTLPGAPVRTTKAAPRTRRAQPLRSRK